MERLARRVEWAVAVSLGAAALWLHWTNVAAAGAFWRDEINSIRLAFSPSVGQFFRDLPFDSAPAAGFALLRVWLTIFGSSSLRFAGLLVGLSLLAAVWLAAKVDRRHAPLLALALLGTNAAVIRIGDSVRSYGLAMIAALAVFAAYGALAKRAGWKVHAAALAAGVFAVQISYYDAVVVFACAVATALVLASRRSYARAAAALAVGGITALTLLPYLPTFRTVRSYGALTRFEPDALWIWRKFEETLALSGPLAVRFWMGLFAVAVVIGPVIVAQTRSSDPEHSNGVLYRYAVLVIGTACFGLFLYSLSYLLQPWYFVTYLALTAACIDGVLAAAVRDHAARLALPLAAAAIAIASVPAALHEVGLRQTNMDVVALRVGSMAAPSDLVIVYPWYCGVSFSHYYAGRAPWQTIPPLADHELHRYDLANAAVSDDGPSAGLLARAERTLAGGGTVWLVTFPLYEESAAYLRKPQAAPPAAAADMRRSAALQRLSASGTSVQLVVPPERTVSGYERMALVSISRTTTHRAPNSRGAAESTPSIR